MTNILHRAAQAVLVMFWVLGVAVGLVVAGAVAVWRAGKTGYRTVRKQD